MFRFKNPLTLLAIVVFFAACSDDSITVSDPPEVSLMTRLSAFTGEEFTQVIQTDDPQGLSVIITVEGLPEWLSFYPEEATLRGTPTSDDAGISALRVVADNGTISRTVNTTVRVFTSRSEQDLQQQLDSAVSSITPGITGVSVAIIDREGDVFLAYNGRSAAGPGGDVLDHRHQFRVASVTKPMTTALILKLIDDGVLDLDDILLDHYDTPLPMAGSMTIQQILSHTAGIFDHLNSSSFWGHPSFSPTKVWTVSEIVQFAINNGSRFNPGTSYGYSNTGFVVIGAVVEEKTGLSLENAFQQMLFEPLGLQETIYDNFSGSSNRIPMLAENNRTYEYHLSAAGAFGAMVASPLDVARFGRAFYGGRYLSDGLTELLDFNYGARAGGQNYGLGTRIWFTGGVRHFGHTGALMDYRNILMYVPQADLTIAMHTHDVNSNWSTLIDNIYSYALSNFSHGLAKPAPFIHGVYDRGYEFDFDSTPGR